MAIIRTVEPAQEPISLALARMQCRAAPEEDELLQLYVAAARVTAEKTTRRALITQTWEQTLDAFPCGSTSIKLLKPPVQAILGVQYVDVNGDIQALAPSAYVLDLRVSPGWLLPAAGTQWPATADVIDAVTITLRAGYGDQAADVPAPIRHWMLLSVGTAYAQREALDATGRVAALPDRYVDGKLDHFIFYGGA